MNRSPIDVEATLRELQDKAAITRLIYSYCECFDRNDPEGVAALFLPEAIIDYNPDTADIRGSEMAQTIALGLRDTFAATSHHVSNIMITLSGEGDAHAMSYVYAWHRYHGDAPDGYLWGRYLHDFVLTDQGWRISRLLLQSAGTNDFHRERMHGIGRAK